MGSLLFLQSVMLSEIKVLGLEMSAARGQAEQKDLLAKLSKLS
jgi:hypothetical protein